MAEQEAEQMAPQEFLDRHGPVDYRQRRSRKQLGRLVLEFSRPDTPVDVHMELCEAIVARAGVPLMGP